MMSKILLWTFCYNSIFICYESKNICSTNTKNTLINLINVLDLMSEIQCKIEDKITREYVNQ